MIKITASKSALNKLKKSLTSNRANRNIRNIAKLQTIIAVASGFSAKEVAEVVGYSVEVIREWVADFLLYGLAFLKVKKSTGRPSKLNEEQKKKLKKIIMEGPEKAGFDGGCWRTPMIQHMIEKIFKAKFSVKYLSEYLNNIGLSYQKAKFVSDHKDPIKRAIWLKDTWPEIMAMANQKNSQILFGDETSFPQWGSLSYTWAIRGEQPVVKTSGCRKGHKVFGLIDYKSGCFYSRAIEGKFNSQSYAEFLLEVLGKSKGHLILIQDGARYHTSKEMNEFFATHKNRISVFQLPSYSPDFNPIEKLWKKIKQKGVHLVHFPDFDSLKNKVNKMLEVFADATTEVLALFGFYDELTLGVR
jgi:transposase